MPAHSCLLRTPARRGHPAAHAVVLPAILALLLAPASGRAAPGDLDPTFGLGGKVETVIADGIQLAHALVIRPDGKIVAVGISGSGDPALVRYDDSGSLDPGFGTGGIVIGDFGGYSEAATGVALQTDGRLVVAGMTAPGGYCCQAVVARYLPDGAPDGSFGTGGKVLTSYFGGLQAFRAVAIQSDGRIVVAGSAYDPFTSVFTLARFLPDGTLDPSFDGDGKVTTDFGGVDGADALLIQPDGKIVVGGRGGPAGEMVIARYLPDGSLDAAFGENGSFVRREGVASAAAALVLDSKGRIVAGGHVNYRSALLRLDGEGRLDASFGEQGVATVVFTGDNLEEFMGLALEPDGHLVGAGRAFVGYEGQFALARFDEDGGLDSDFGASGRVLTNFTGDEWARVVALDAEGRIVAAGGWNALNLARYLGGSSAAEVSIVIKGGGGAVCVNTESRGVVPVAVLSTDEFDATRVDPAATCFGSADDPASANCSEFHGHGHLEDVNRDGRTDLVLHYEVRATGIEATDTRACLAGRTLDGVAFEGCADLRICPRIAGRSDFRTTSHAQQGEPETGDEVAVLPGITSVSARTSSCRVRFRLTSSRPAALQLLDVAGRIVAGEDVRSFGPGSHEVTLTRGHEGGPGVYWVRLTHEGVATSKRVVLLD